MIQKSGPIYLWNVLQGSEEWERVRRGIPTASEFSKLLTPAKLQPSASRFKYIRQLIAETLPSYLPPLPSNSMMRGTDLESDARKMYSFIRSVDAQEVGFVYGDASKRWGASPDALIGEDGGAEYKCPEAETHLEYIETGMPKAHFPQVNGNLLATGRQWWDWMSYHPDLKPVIVRVERSGEQYMKWESKFKPVLESFLERLQKAKEQLGVK